MMHANNANIFEMYFDVLKVAFGLLVYNLYSSLHSSVVFTEWISTTLQYGH